MKEPGGVAFPGELVELFIDAADDPDVAGPRRDRGTAIGEEIEAAETEPRFVRVLEGRRSESTCRPLSSPRLPCRGHRFGERTPVNGTSSDSFPTCSNALAPCNRPLPPPNNAEMAGNSLAGTRPPTNTSDSSGPLGPPTFATTSSPRLRDHHRARWSSFDWADRRQEIAASSRQRGPHRHALCVHSTPAYQAHVIRRCTNDALVAR